MVDALPSLEDSTNPDRWAMRLAPAPTGRAWMEPDAEPGSLSAASSSSRTQAGWLVRNRLSCPAREATSAARSEAQERGWHDYIIGVLPDGGRAHISADEAEPSTVRA